MRWVKKKNHSNKNRLHFLLLLGRFQVARMLFEQIPTNANDHRQIVRFPDECATIESKFRLVHGRHRVGHCQCFRIIEQPFGHHECVQQIQRVPNVGVHSHQDRSSARQSGDRVQQVSGNEVDEDCGQLPQEERGQQFQMSVPDARLQRIVVEVGVHLVLETAPTEWVARGGGRMKNVQLLVAVYKNIC